MVWEKEIPARAGTRGWRDDLPLDHELPRSLGLDCRKLEPPIHPMFAVRLRVFIDWHRDSGREVVVTPPLDPLAHRVFTVSELCNNAVDHGANRLGAYAAVRRVSRPRRELSIAISDLGIGIPEHIRQQYPEWGDDGPAIAHATQESVSGIGDPHRGIGFSAVMEAALTGAASRFRRGTWITYDLVSV